MMETSILNQLPFDPGFLILGLIGLVLILLIFLISTMVQLKSLTRKYDYYAGKRCRNIGRCDHGSD